MKRYLFLCLLLSSILTSSVFAQLSVGVQGGYTRNYLYTSAGYRVFTQYDPAAGFNIGIPVRYAVNRWLAFQIEPQLIQKNYQLTRTGFYEGIYQATTNQYLQLPVMGHFSFGGSQLKGFLNLGGYAGYWTTGANKGVTTEVTRALDNVTQANHLLDVEGSLHFDESYRFDSRKDQRLEIGWLAGVGLSYQIARYTFSVEGRYYEALSDQQKDYMIHQIPRYNQTYVLQIGCLYQLNQR